MSWPPPPPPPGGGPPGGVPPAGGRAPVPPPPPPSSGNSAAADLFGAPHQQQQSGPGQPPPPHIAAGTGGGGGGGGGFPPPPTMMGGGGAGGGGGYHHHQPPTPHPSSAPPPPRPPPPAPVQQQQGQPYQTPSHGGQQHVAMSSHQHQAPASYGGGAGGMSSTPAYNGGHAGGTTAMHNSNSGGGRNAAAAAPSPYGGGGVGAGGGNAGGGAAAARDLFGGGGGGGGGGPITGRSAAAPAPPLPPKSTPAPTPASGPSGSVGAGGGGSFPTTTSAPPAPAPPRNINATPSPPPPYGYDGKPVMPPQQQQQQQQHHPHPATGTSQMAKAPSPPTFVGGGGGTGAPPHPYPPPPPSNASQQTTETASSTSGGSGYRYGGAAGGGGATTNNHHGNNAAAGGVGGGGFEMPSLPPRAPPPGAGVMSPTTAMAPPVPNNNAHPRGSTPVAQSISGGGGYLPPPPGAMNGSGQHQLSGGSRPEPFHATKPPARFPGQATRMSTTPRRPPPMMGGQQQQQHHPGMTPQQQQQQQHGHAPPHPGHVAPHHQHQPHQHHHQMPGGGAPPPPQHPHPPQQQYPNAMQQHPMPGPTNHGYQQQHQRYGQQQPPHAPMPPPPNSAMQQPRPSAANTSGMAEPPPRIDPSQIPRIPCVTKPHLAPATIYHPRNELHLDYAHDPYSSSSNNKRGGGGVVSQAPNVTIRPPPDAYERYVSVDDGNANPRWIRCTTAAYPINRNVSEKTGIPLAVVVTPFAKRGSVLPDIMPPPPGGGGGGRLTTGGESRDVEDVPLLTYPPHREPIRCVHCGAYLNPFVKSLEPHRDTGASYEFECNFCGTENDSTASYHEQLEYAHWGMFGADMSEIYGDEDANDVSLMENVRVGTRYAVTDHVVGGKYVVRKPRRPVHVYAIDINGSSSSSGSSSDVVGREEVFGEHLRSILTSIRHVAEMLRRDFDVVRRDYDEAVSAEKRQRQAQHSSSSGGGGGGNGNREEERRRRLHPPPEWENEIELPYRPHVGIVLYDGRAVYVPYWKSHRGGGNEPKREGEEYSGPGELCLSVMSDVYDDPFCPLPPDNFCYDVTSDLGGMDLLIETIDAVPSLVGMLDGGSGGGGGGGGGAGDLSRQQPTPPRGPGRPRQMQQQYESAGGAALKVLSDSLRLTGGRATLITSSRPTVGVGMLRNRAYAQQTRNYVPPWKPLQHVHKSQLDGNETDVAAAQFYDALGKTCNQLSVCVDVVIVPPPGSTDGVMGDRDEYRDVGTLGEFCRVTCGTIKLVSFGCGSNGGEEKDEDDDGGGECQLTQELCRAASPLHGSIGQDAVFKMRHSDGIRVKSYIGYPPGVQVNQGLDDSPELEMSRVGVDTAISVAFDFRVGGLPKDHGNCVHFQAAVLYTTAVGQRRVRVITLSVRTTNVAHDVFRGSDYSTVGAVVTRLAIMDVIGDGKKEDEGKRDGLELARKGIVDRCVNILTCYRMNTTARKSPSGQLILPETLQLLPIFCLSLRKTLMFRRTRHNSNLPLTAGEEDERAAEVFVLNQVPPELSTLLVHPSMYRLDNLAEGEGYPYTPTHHHQHAMAGGDAETSAIAAACRPFVRLPSTVHPSIACLQDDGVYLLDDGKSLFIYVGKDVSDTARLELFNASGLGLSRTSDFGARVRNIVHQMRIWSSMRPTFPPIILVLQEGSRVASSSPWSPEELERRQSKMRSLLVDDPTMHEKGYVDFLCMLHKQIRLTMQQREK